MSNLITETRIEFGAAARRNRGRHSGQKIHRLFCEYIVGRVDASITPKPRTFEAQFVATQKPVLIHAHPTCGCTQGQFAGTPLVGLTEDRITCTKCRPK